MSKLENNTASLQAVSEKINGVNNEINSQATTIAEIAALLEGKSVPGDGSSSGAVETCAVTLVDAAGFGSQWWVRYIGVDGSPLIFEHSGFELNPEFIINVYPNSFLFVSCDIIEIDGEAQILENSGNGRYGLAYISGDATVSFYTG